MRHAKWIRLAGTAAAVAALLVVVGCKAGAGTSGGAVTKKEGPAVKVGSMLDSEGSVLGSMVIQMLEANGITTVDKTKLGTPDVCRKAITEGEIDITIDYTGSGQYYHEDLASLDVWNDAAKAYETIEKADRERGELYWLTPSPANNTEMIATTQKLAGEKQIVTLVDFAAYVNSGGPVKLICSQTFADNEKGLKGIEAAYGFTLRQDQLVILADGVTSRMLNDLARGTDGVNFSLAYGTDGQLGDLGLVTVLDPKSVPPVYEPAPVVRGAIMKAYPEIAGILEPVFESLTLEKLRELNKRVTFGGEDPKAVAKDYLTRNGFLK